MKKVLSALLCTVLLFSAIPLGTITVSAASYSGTCGDNLTWSFDTETGVLDITGSGAMKNYNSSSAPWYNNRSSVKTVNIGNGVTSIGNSAFVRCTGLTSVTIPDSVSEIGYDVFYDCTGLTKVNITDLSAWCKIKFDGSSANPLSYAKHLYLNGSEITDLVIPDDVTSIGSYAFYGCTGLERVTIPDSVTSIGDYAFYYCTGLERVTIPDSVTSIGDYAFRDCEGLTSVTIGNSVTSIGSYAFSGCTGLTYNTYDNANYLGNTDNPYLVLVEAKSKNITSCTINNKTRFIHSGAFSWCTGLTSVTIGDSVTSIGSSAFSDCEGLTSVTIGNSVTSIGDGAFRYCTGLTSITIPNSVTSIGSSAFCGCTGLTSITIPNSVTSIGSSAFSNCPATIYGVFGSEAERYALANGMKFIELPEKIKIFYMPDKLTYTLNSKLDLEGLIVAIYYPSGLLEWRYKGFEVSGFDTSAPGTKTVTIKYLGATASFDIEVTGVIGDGNGDGKTDAEDLTLLTNAIINGAEYNGNLDINGNGSLDILDIIALKKLLADNPV